MNFGRRLQLDYLGSVEVLALVERTDDDDETEARWLWLPGKFTNLPIVFREERVI